MTETNGIDLNQVATFVRVMEAGSFTAAARTMGLPKSSVSRRITLLEKALLLRYPKVQIEMVMTARNVDLVNEGFDLALRAKRLDDSSLMARHLGRSDMALFASRTYLQRAGVPQRVGELARHRFVLFGDLRRRHELRLTGAAGEETVPVDGPLVLDEMEVAVDAVVAGVGIGLIPLGYLRFLEHGGRGATRRSLVRVLPRYQIPGAELNLVSPPNAYEPTRVKLFRDFLTERLRPLLRADAASSSRERPPASTRAGARATASSEEPA
ncbi:MAG TPA: LysR family transcriptional regulator [Polyangia bacterium]|nr:LysR family transcriptional regulator [Polyangia bacterium]